MFRLRRSAPLLLVLVTACMLLGQGCTDSRSNAASSSDSHPAPASSSSAPASSSGSSGSFSGSPAASDSSSSSLQTVQITFPEGTTLAKMFLMLDEAGVADFDALLSAAETMDLASYPLAGAVSMTPERCYRLEGYLFPDTYEFYLGEPAESILGKMLDNTQNRIPDEYADRAGELGLSMDEAIILASLIQKEAGPESEMPHVSSVLHNRLEAGMQLQLNATITYVEYVILPFFPDTRDLYAPAYNTYKCAALPAGPICNPGLSALQAALWPEDTEDFYFAMDDEGNHYYSQTYEEHVAICREHGIGIYAEE